MSFSGVVQDWKHVEPRRSPVGVDTRLQIHWAAQALAAVGEALVAPQPDFSHTSLTWVEARGLLVGQVTKLGVRVGLDVAALRLCVLDANGQGPSRILGGTTLDAAVGWLQEALGPDAGPSKLQLPTYELPDHEVGRGGIFSVDPAAAAQLASWYSNAASVHAAVIRNTQGASPVRCWPHHFDIATLIALDPPGLDPEEARSIGVGMTPGDDGIQEPYFYVNPWPPPEGGQLPGLEGGGHWHRKGWTGAILPASKLTASTAEEQGEQVVAFVQSAMAAGRTLLGAA